MSLFAIGDLHLHFQSEPKAKNQLTDRLWREHEKKLKKHCAKTGACLDCKSPDTICCQFLITRFSRHAGRIHVILVNDILGF